MATRLLKEDEYLLGKRQIKGTQKVSKQTLARYYQQQPNTTWLGIPWGQWIYQTGECYFDKESIQQRIAKIEADFDAKIVAAAGDEQRVKYLEQQRAKKIKTQKKQLQKGNLLMRWGEAPVIYSPQQRQLTEKNLLAYLHSKGYLKAQVSSTVELRDQRASITYHIQENQPHLIGAIRLYIPDQAIKKLLQTHQQQSLLKKGALYNQEVLGQERERIYELLSNHGYFSFERQYIRFEVDTTAVDNSVVIKTVIETPTGSQAHLVSHIDQVIWDVHEDQSEKASHEASISYGGITLRHLSPQFNPRILANKLPIYPPQLYRKQDLIETQRRLTRLGMFKYINITYDIADNGRLIPHIHTSPVDRFQLANEIGLQVSYWLPSPFYKLSLASRNLLGRLETLTLATHVGAEGASVTTSKRGFTSSQALGIDLSLSLPQFLLPINDTTQACLERFNPATTLSAGYDFTRRPDYKQNIFKGVLSYTWQDQGSGAYEWIPLRIDWIDTKVNKRFKKHLEKLKDQGNNLYRVFRPFWLSLFSFRSTFRKEPVSDADLSYWLLELFFESAGTLQNFVDLRRRMPDFAHYQYVKLNIVYSQHAPIFSSTIFAYRLHTGIANPYSEYQVLPYNRYYFIGGANTMRAWAPRSLGPGTYSPPKSADEKYHPDQPGELLLQGSAELRQQLGDFLEGALFVDAGNIWTLREDGRPGGQFSFQDFYKAIAVGTGIGIRFKFSFVVLRLDMGLKVYDPARPAGERFVGHKIALNKHWGLPGQAVYNIGIGYPF
ncbi:MAG: BamA/TamA family outer membrane protein [Bacteroidota bacterium]